MWFLWLCGVTVFVSSPNNWDQVDLTFLHQFVPFVQMPVNCAVLMGVLIVFHSYCETENEEHDIYC